MNGVAFDDTKQSSVSGQSNHSLTNDVIRQAGWLCIHHFPPAFPVVMTDAAILLVVVV